MEKTHIVQRKLKREKERNKWEVKEVLSLWSEKKFKKVFPVDGKKEITKKSKKKIACTEFFFL